MNKTKYLALAFAALTLGACTSDDVVVQNDPNVAQGGETSYVSLAVNLPTQPSTRAEGFAGLDDGTPEEYDVKDGILVLFAGADEATATVASAYTLNVDGLFQDESNNNHITSQATLVREVVKPSTSGNIYALVILNPNDVVKVDGTTLKIGAESFSGTFKDLTEKAIAIDDVNKVTSKGFLMSNAPLFSVQGGTTKPDGGSVSTLAVMDKNKFYTTPTTATNNPAAEIYVERAVAKVTVHADGGDVTGGNPYLVSYTIAGWTLDVTNKKTYLVRNVAPATGSWWNYANGEVGSANEPYRFVGSTPVATDKYRTYWGIDPNYDKYVETDFNVSDGVIDNAKLVAGDGVAALYCLENTFDTQNMNNDQTTRVILNAKLNLDETLAEEDGTFFVLDDNTGTIYNEKGIKDVVKTWVQEWIEERKEEYIETGMITEDNLTVTLPTGTSDPGGYIGVTSVVVSDDESKITWVSDGLSKLNADIAENLESIVGNHKIGYYKNGYSYYEVRIKHFGDSQTPWTATGEDGSYGSGNTGENNWLGRWGVLRNNWYDLTISVKNIGSPDVPDVENKPDDPEALYVAVKINILSWAKRTQDVEL